MKIKLILFLDCNKTLLLADKAKGADVMMQLNTELASLSNYKADWDDSGRVQTYRMYTRKLYPSLEQKNEFQLLNQKFLDHLKATNHPHLSKVQKKLAKIQLALNDLDSHHLKSGETYQVFSSAMEMFYWLEKNKDIFSYTAVLRTFGQDGPHVEKEITERMHLAGFNDFKFSHRGQFDAEHVLKINDKTYFTPKEIFELIEPNVHHAWRDNYKYWNQHGQLNEFGKLFPINKPSMTEEDITLPIFFDDNVFDEVCPEEGIIAVKSIDESYKPVFEELRQREQIVHVNPLKALSDKSYFIHKIIQAIAYYSLKSKQVAETLQNELIQNDLVSSGMPNENTSHFLSFKRSKAEPELQNSVQAVDEDKKQKILM